MSIQHMNEFDESMRLEVFVTKRLTLLLVKCVILVVSPNLLLSVMPDILQIQVIRCCCFYSLHYKGQTYILLYYRKKEN